MGSATILSRYSCSSKFLAKACAPYKTESVNIIRFWEATPSVCVGSDFSLSSLVA